jgi:WD40 repeat protein
MVANKIAAALFLIGISLSAWAGETLVPAQPPMMMIEDAHAAGSINVAFSPGNRYLASAGYFGEIKIWSLPDLRPVRTFVERGKKPYGLGWTDDQSVISGDSNGRIYFRRITDGKILKSTRTPSSITAMVVWADKNRVFTGHRDGVLRVFDSTSLEQMAEYDVGSQIVSLAGDRNGNRLAVLCRSGRIFLLNSNLSEPKELTSPPGRTFQVAFSPNGKQLAGGGWFKLFFWDISKNTLDVVRSDHRGQVRSIDYTPDGKYLATIGYFTDSQILLLDPKTGKVDRRLLPHDACGLAVRISPDGHYLASGSDDASIRLYDLSVPSHRYDYFPILDWKGSR